MRFCVLILLVEMKEHPLKKHSHPFSCMTGTETCSISFILVEQASLPASKGALHLYHRIFQGADATYLHANGVARLQAEIVGRNNSCPGQ